MTWGCRDGLQIDVLDNDTVHIVFGNLGFQACRLSMRRVTSVEFTLAPPLCVNTGRLAHAAASSLSAARVCPVSKQIAQRHET